jgi:hypothetical protein
MQVRIEVLLKDTQPQQTTIYESDFRNSVGLVSLNFLDLMDFIEVTYRSKDVIITTSFSDLNGKW